MLLETANGNVLWDLIALLNDKTVEFVNLPSTDLDGSWDITLTVPRRSNPEAV